MVPRSPQLPPSLSTGQTLANSGSVPLLFPALQATWFLESLTDDDVPALENAMSALDGWLGPSMRWAWSSVHAEVQPYRADDLDYVTYCPNQFRNPHAHVETAQSTAALLQHMDLMTRDVFGVSTHGGMLSNHASPVSMHFLAEVLDLPHGDWFVNASCLQVFVPVSWPLEDFVSRVDALTLTLPTRWATAGLGLSHWEFDAPESSRRAIFAAARRYPGFDVPFCAGLLKHWQNRPRSVSWRNYLRNDLAERALARAVPDKQLTIVTQLQDILVLQAGDVPVAGDHNKRQYPHAYAAVEQFLRPDPRDAGLSFGDPWTEATTAAWLNRFCST